MTKGKESIRKRRESLLNSQENTERGGFTKVAAERMVGPFGGQRAECTVTTYCRTSIFEYPGAHLEEAVPPHIVYSHNEIKVAIVSDLPRYFDQCPAGCLHYSIDVSLRADVRSAYENAFARASRQPGPRAPLFLVIEEYPEVPRIELNSGECFAIDEFQNGEAVFEGGREGKRSLVAVKTIDGSWPDFQPDTHTINVVLAAVKALQNFAHHIEEVYSCSCFVDSEGQAIGIITPRISVEPQPEVKCLQAGQLQDRANALSSMLQTMMLDSEPAAAELFDSIILDNNRDDSYLRLWYLRLWQALEDAGRHLGCRQPSNKNTIIAGTSTLKELYGHRNEIAHWYTGKIDFSLLNDLQYTTTELLRRKYGLSRNEPSD